MGSRPGRLIRSELQVVSAWDIAAEHLRAMSVPNTADPIENQRRGLQHLVSDVLGEEPNVDLFLRSGADFRLSGTDQDRRGPAGCSGSSNVFVRLLPTGSETGPDGANSRLL
jgi:hypothetical protein